MTDYSGFDSAISRAERALVDGVEVDSRVSMALTLQCLKGLRIVMDQTEFLNRKIDALIDALEETEGT